jgi:hypothetical protein
VIALLMVGFFSNLLSFDKLKEASAAGPFSRRASAHGAYEETKRISNYAGSDLLDRDTTAVFLDWDDTLFPSTYVKDVQRRCSATQQPLDLYNNPKMKVLAREIKSFLCAAARVGHVFIVTAATHNFVRKCCRICFPELLNVLDDLQVTVIYARPIGDAEVEEPIENWKRAVYSKILHAPHLRPLPPQLARFYDSTGWRNIISYGDQWTDHTSLLSAAASSEPQLGIKILKAHCTEDGLFPGSLAQELRVVGRMLADLAALDVGCTYDLDKPDVRCAFELPVQNGPSSPSSSLSIGFLSRDVSQALTPKSKRSASSSSISEPGTTPVHGQVFKNSIYCGTDTETNPDYLQDMDITPSHNNHK